VKDAAGCVSTKAITVGAAPAITVTPFAGAATSCANDGYIEIYRSGGIPPYTYSLDNITYISNNKFLNLAAGPYTAWVKDSKGCTGSQAVTVTQGVALTVSAVKTNTSSCVNDGTIQVNASGGVGPYTYKLDGGSFQVSNSFTGLTNTSYVVTVKLTVTRSLSQPMRSEQALAQARMVRYSYSGQAEWDLIPIASTAIFTNRATCLPD
jgi:hypothetical protein